MEKEAQEYIDLAKACYDDDFEEVKRIMDKHPEIDLNHQTLHSKSRANGAPLILIADPKIGRYLVEKGAKVNQEYKHNGIYITALDSAKEELTKGGTSEEVKIMVKDYITFLEDKGAKTYEELPRDGK